MLLLSVRDVPAWLCSVAEHLESLFQRLIVHGFAVRRQTRKEGPSPARLRSWIAHRLAAKQNQQIPRP